MERRPLPDDVYCPNPDCVHFGQVETRQLERHGSAVRQEPQAEGWPGFGALFERRGLAWSGPGVGDRVGG